MTDEERPKSLEEFPDMELPMPKGFDEEKIIDLKERKAKVMQQIDTVISGGKIKPKGSSMTFSFYTPPEKKKHEVGETWVDEDGKEWVQRNGYSISIPNIDHVDLEQGGYLMPTHCPKCGKALTRALDKKMWRFNRFCMDCTAEYETQLQIEGTYRDYERKRIMSNIRAFYNDVTDGLDDYVNSMDATYVNEFGDVEKWDRVNKPMLRSMILNDLKLLKEDFEKNFGEEL
jgi:hypothetical protein